MKKIYISSSDQDESYKDKLIAHLHNLIRRNEICAWHRSDVLVGEVIVDKINEKMAEADIIILMYSPESIASQVNFDIELSRSFDLLNENDYLRIIPVCIRPCDIEGSPLDGLESYPRCGTLSQITDIDNAYTEIVSVIKQTLTVNQKPILCQPELSESFKNWLNDTEVVLKHRATENISLDNVYVSPDLRNLDSDKDSYKETSSAALVDKDGFVIILGEEQSGKTALSKFIFKHKFNASKFPIYIDASNIANNRIIDACNKALASQYSNISCLDEIKKEDRLLILDNLNNIGLNNKNQNILLSAIECEFNACIILASESFKYIIPDIEELALYSVKEILPFGNSKREKLIEKWVSLGREEEIQEAELFYNVDNLKNKIDTLVRRSIIPPKPIYLLSLLQIFEAYNPQQVDLTSYGHCYHYLVYQALEKSKISSSEIEKYINIMTEFSWAQFGNNGELNDNDLDLFFKHYAVTYLSVDKNKVIECLLNSSILTKNERGYKFKYPYIYYFFTAKYISEKYSKDQAIKERFSYLLENLHKEDCANIIIFITHHTKDEWILDEIQMCMMELFQEEEVASLEKNTLKFMENFIDDIPDLVLEKRKIEDEREKRAIALDKMEVKAADLEDQIDNLEPNDTLAKINKAFKGIEIVGQIVRNRSASLPKAVLVDIVEEGFSTGLRFLTYFLGLADTSKDEIAKIIEHVLKENPRVSNKDLEKEAKHTYMLLTYGVIFGVLKKISSSMGGVEVEEICDIIENKNKSPAISLINQSMHLHFHKRLDFSRIDNLQKEFHTNPTCRKILRETIIQHTYMFPVGYKDKQRLSHILNVSMQVQRRLENAKGGKLLSGHS
ncbi:TIR domain-containing protein [Cobetia sp. MMG027]|uniref:STAND family AAA ATPase n=1 Tax=Cobetia sp. MMG027 TaxID=3021980 RepID=UPI0022FED281|nr:TIR domain-containing protein [Cobetia sp. MMG027]MDA5564404.1 TIR domain-containing protein [Cobetia sp. MMG027]